MSDTPQEVTPLTVSVLRELFRHLVSWRSVFEAEPCSDVLPTPDGGGITLWDVEFLYGLRTHLPERQRQAIEWFLVEDMLERDVALRMGVSPTNPVGMYATSGLEKMVGWWNEQDFPRALLPEVDRSPKRWLRCHPCGEKVALVDPTSKMEVVRAMRDHEHKEVADGQAA